MAYGVKYRLEFSDVKGNKRKVEILKKDYVSSVLPMVCQGEPVTIEWRADNDIYEPLIGSNASLHLMVTDTVSYDNFYEYDEREYLLKISYESSVGVYSVYWLGFISNDIYTEAITTTPYPLTINATDGLGSLEGFNTWMPANGEADPTLWKFIHNNLNYLSLDFNIYISNDIRGSAESEWGNVFNIVSIKKTGMFHKNYIIWDAKTVLRSILIGFNCKIFQAFGRWYIVNSSSYGDQRIIAGIQNGTYTGNGILSAKQAFLAGGTEEIKYLIYDYLGVYANSIQPSMLYIAPSQAQPINNNLVREIKRPVKRYQEIVNIEQKQIDLNYNGSFEFDLENWSNDSGSYTISDVPFAGLKSYRFTEYTQVLGTYTQKLHSTGGENIVKGNQYQLLISVNVDEASGGFNGTRIPYYIRYYNSGNYWYWSTVNQSWGSSGTIGWNDEKILNAEGEYEVIKITTGAAPDGGPMEIGIGVTYIDASGSYTATYIDNFVLRNIDTEQNVYKEILFIRVQNTSFIATDLMEHEGIYQSSVPDFIFLGAFFTNNTFKRAQDSTAKVIEEIVTQQRINDFRQYSKTYEGDFYNQVQYDMLSMAYKFFINFATPETDSAIMDSIKLSVKSNVYTVRCHIPNNYTDIANNYRVSYQE